jgi:release factor glutamine methyltransferase
MIGFNLGKTKRLFIEKLSEKFPQREAEQLMRILLEDLFGIDLKRQLMDPNLCIDERQHYLLSETVRRLLEGEPVQYVTGMARFGDLLIKVSPAVLIPRPETEELVQKIGTGLSRKTTIQPCHSSMGSAAMSFQRGHVREREMLSIRRSQSMAAVTMDNPPKRIWDIGTGSGCIAIALAKRFPDAEVIAFDVSDEALQIAKENAESNGVKVIFVHDDVLHPQSDYFNQPVDLVVSNPPYVCDSERAAMEANVLDWEPGTALFVPDDDPLRFYRKILELAKKQLNPDGQVWLEINEQMGEEMLLLCREMGFAEAEVLEDYVGKQRFCHVCQASRKQ